MLFISKALQLLSIRGEFYGVCEVFITFAVTKYKIHRTRLICITLFM